VVLIRHADVDADGPDPVLNTAGSARAQQLRHVVGDAGIDLILVTSLRRSGQTAAPLAAALGIAPVTTDATDDAMSAIRSRPSASAVLVVGHTNTVPQIIEGLGGPAGVTIGAEEFDRLFVLSARRLVHLRYGA